MAAIISVRSALVAACLLTAQSWAAQAWAGDEQARLLAGACIACHGPAGRAAPGMPAIEGTLTPVAFIATMQAFRAGQRENTIMGRISRGYTESEIALLADYFGRDR